MANHHFVPVQYMNRFADPDAKPFKGRGRRVHCLDKQKPERRLFVGNTEKLMRISGFHDAKLGDLVKLDGEDWVTKLENELLSPLTTILDPAWVPNANDIATLHLLAWSMYMRNPAAGALRTRDALVTALGPKRVGELEARGVDTDQASLAHLMSMRGAFASGVLQEESRRPVRLYLATGRWRFVTSDRPAQLVRLRGGLNPHDGAQLRMPLSPTHLLVLDALGSAPDFTFDARVVDEDYVVDANKMARRGAVRFVVASRRFDLV